MEKDRAKFGPEYGDRFCMLQLVGRHEMDKVTLLRESDMNSSKLLASLHITIYLDPSYNAEMTGHIIL